MSTHSSSQKHRSYESAQAMVEFAITPPILIFLRVGILEVGRRIFSFASMINASRDAVCYPSAVGYADRITCKKFQYCAGFREVVKGVDSRMSLSESSYRLFFVVSSYGPVISPKSPVQIKFGNKGSSLPSCPRKVDLMIHAIIFLFFSLLFGMRRP